MTTSVVYNTSMVFRNESLLITHLKRGDSRAVKDWYSQAANKLELFFSSRVSCEADAQELVHDTFMSCLASLPLFRGDSGLYTWMLGIARHELADYWRKKYAKKIISLLPFGEELIESVAAPSSVSGDDLTELLTRLPQDLSEVLQLKYVDGKSVKEIAQHFGVSVPAMQSRIYRAKEVLAREYGKWSEGSV